MNCQQSKPALGWTKAETSALGYLTLLQRTKDLFRRYGLVFDPDPDGIVDGICDGRSDRIHRWFAGAFCAVWSWGNRLFNEYNFRFRQVQCGRNLVRREIIADQGPPVIEAIILCSHLFGSLLGKLNGKNQKMEEDWIPLIWARLDPRWSALHVSQQQLLQLLHMYLFFLYDALQLLDDFFIQNERFEHVVKENRVFLEFNKGVN